MEARGSIRPLDATAEFRLARQTLPLDRDDTVFAYLSPAFFRGLMSPQYQIELRGGCAVADLEVLQMARGRPKSKERLIADLIGPRRVVAAQYRTAARRQPSDTTRRPVGGEPAGARGTFVPIPDMELRSVTPAEAAQYQQSRIPSQPVGSYGSVDCDVETLFPGAGGAERLRIEARMLPFDRQKYGLVTSIVGPPSQMQLRPAAEDIASIQLVVQGGLLRPEVGPHLLFLGLRNTDAPLDFGRRSPCAPC